LGSGIGQTSARHHDGYGREISDQDVSQQPRFRLHGDARFRAQLPDARTDLAGRCPGASVRRRHGGCDARAEGRSEHVPVEGAQGADSPRGEPDTFLPTGASASFCLDGGVHTTGRQAPAANLVTVVSDLVVPVGGEAATVEVYSVPGDLAFRIKAPDSAGCLIRSRIAPLSIRYSRTRKTNT